MNNYITSFLCLPTLELTTFEQQVCSIKTGYVNVLSWGQTATKERNVTTLNSGHQAKESSANLIVVVWNCNKACTLFILNLLNLRDLFGVSTKLKEIIFKNNHQMNSTVTTEHGFFRQNGLERCEVQVWYPNEKNLVVPVCLTGRCCSSECVGVVSY